MLETKGFQQWSLAHACLMAGGSIGLFFFGALWIMGAATLLSFSVLFFFGRDNLRRFHPFGGYANWVTGLRLLLLLVLAFYHQNFPPLVIFGTVVLSLLLDGLDGYLARRYQHDSTFGMHFDIEVDAFTGALLAGMHFVADIAGGWILLIGSLRYLYVLSIAGFGLWNRKAKSLQLARIIGMVFLSGFLGPFIVPLWLAYPALLISALLVAYSFGYSFYSLLQAKKK